MPKFSANLGFLWTELALPEAIRAAANAGFTAVECHWPFEYSVAEVRSALDETGLPMLGLNTLKGTQPGDFGLAAVPDRKTEAREVIDQAIDYAQQCGIANVHVMAGRTDAGAAADQCFRDNLLYASRKAASHNINILLEPINQRDVPGYHFSLVEEAVALIEALKQSNIKVLFDCYHSQIMQGDLITCARTHLDHIGHIQIAAVPDRGEPDDGEIAYPALLKAFDDMGYSGYIGAEYKPRTDTASGLGWLQQYR